MTNISKKTEYTIPCITNNGDNASYFSMKSITLSGDLSRMLSEQQHCINFRLRTSPSNYTSDFHVAGDPTLLIILQGSMQIELRNGEQQCFNKGELFIAEDYLLETIPFDHEQHGHKASVIGTDDLHALHLKLDKR